MWVRRSRNGTRYLRIHIEPAWQSDEDDGDLEDDDLDGAGEYYDQPVDQDDDDIPF